ncbi:MAG: 3D domain-containing protein [Vescimonas sp.]
MAVASDTGSAIKGTKLDLWFDSYDDACSFGRRYCTVYVLN